MEKTLEIFDVAYNEELNETTFVAKRFDVAEDGAKTEDSESTHTVAGNLTEDECVEYAKTLIAPEEEIGVEAEA